MIEGTILQHEHEEMVDVVEWHVVPRGVVQIAAGRIFIIASGAKIQPSGDYPLPQ